VFAVHPRTQEAIARYGITRGGIRAVKPVGYFDMVDMARLLDRAALVMTDSGGLQKEAYFVRRYHVVRGDRVAYYGPRLEPSLDLARLARTLRHCEATPPKG
jgi:hypothetical protein